MQVASERSKVNLYGNRIPRFSRILMQVVPVADNSSELFSQSSTSRKAMNVQRVQSYEGYHKEQMCEPEHQNFFYLTIVENQSPSPL